MADTSAPALLQRFSEEAEKLRAQVYCAADEASAIQHLLGILGQDREVIAWDLAQIPLAGLGQALQAQGVQIAPSRSEHVRVGITGASAALAATGSLVMVAGPGRIRTASLIPFCHVAVIRQAQILPDFEAWVALQRQAGLEAFRQASNITLISGTSRTADIAMQMIMGVHGPGEVHIIILP
jgi:L-lactate dehydrogenase complex protein LldG